MLILILNYGIFIIILVSRHKRSMKDESFELKSALKTGSEKNLLKYPILHRRQSHYKKKINWPRFGNQC